MKEYGRPLGKGIVGLIDVMPNQPYLKEGEDNCITPADAAILEAARVSYLNSNSKRKSTDAGLIRYLLRNNHTSPFEMVEFKFYIKTPIFIARQWMRHRTGSFNEVSARYSLVKEEFYEPMVYEICKQSVDNKQGRGDQFQLEEQREIQTQMRSANDASFQTYQDLINKGVARELARTVLPVSTFTEFYWKVDLLNLLKFIRLRIDKHAQLEIRVYAEALLEAVKEHAPLTYQAFLDYWVDSVSIPSHLISATNVSFDSSKIEVQLEDSNVPASLKREIKEILLRFKKSY